MARDAAITAARAGAAPLRATGLCLYCDEPAADGRRFCGPECRDGFEVERRVRGRARGR
jgi:hypothetical protein